MGIIFSNNNREAWSEFFHFSPSVTPSMGYLTDEQIEMCELRISNRVVIIISLILNMTSQPSPLWLDICISGPSSLHYSSSL